MPARAALVVTAVVATAFVLVRDPYSPVAPTLLALAVAFAALGVFVALEARRPRLDRRLVLAAGAGLLALAVAVPPLQSRDLWSYAMYGRIVVHYHASPYEHVPAQWPADKWTLHVAHGWRQTPSVYGPAFTAFSAAGMAAVGRSFLAARLFFQLSAALAVVAAAWLVSRHTKSAAAVALLALNPLVIVSVVNGGHNDAIVGLAVLGGVLLAARRHPAWAGAVLAGAAMIKASAALPLLAVAFWVWHRDGRRAVIRLLATAGAIGLTGYMVTGGLDGLRPLQAAGLDFSGASVWYGPRRWLAAALRHGRAAGAAGHLARQILSTVAVALVGAVGWLLARRRLHTPTPALAAGAAAFAYVLAGAYVLPWYVYWGLPALALAWRTRLTWLVAAYGAVLYLAEVPDLTANPRVNRLFVASPLQRVRSDVYLIWLPLAEALLLAILVVGSLRRRRTGRAPGYDSALLAAPLPTYPFPSGMITSPVVKRTSTGQE